MTRWKQRVLSFHWFACYLTSFPSGGSEEWLAFRGYLQMHDALRDMNN